MKTGNCWTGLNRADGGFRRSRYIVYFAFAIAIVALNGCGNCSDRCDDPTIYVNEITSDVEADGDIGLTPDAVYTISSALDAGNVWAGIDPATGEEFRGFLDFPLRGKSGIPLNAAIESATLEVYISWMSESPPDRIFPFIIDLVTFQPPILIADDFNRVAQPPLLTMPFDFYPSDVGYFVTIDVTPLMTEAQIQKLPDFQLRFLLDFSADSGLIEIDDGDVDTAPLLTVSYL